MRKLSFDEIEPGQRFVSTGLTLTETDHGLFMMLVGDWHPIHADEDYASRTPAGRRLMHGSFGLALAMGIQASLVEFADRLIGATGVDGWRFKAPLFIGDTVHVEMEMLTKRVTSDRRRYIVERRIDLVRSDGTLLQGGVAGAMLWLPDEAGVPSAHVDRA